MGGGTAETCRCHIVLVVTNPIKPGSPGKCSLQCATQVHRHKQPHTHTHARAQGGEQVDLQVCGEMQSGGKDEVSLYTHTYTQKTSLTWRKLISHLLLINYALEKANRGDDGKRNEKLKEKWIFNPLPPSSVCFTSLLFFIVLPSLLLFYLCCNQSFRHSLSSHLC